MCTSMCPTVGTRAKPLTRSNARTVTESVATRHATMPCPDASRRRQSGKLVEHPSRRHLWPTNDMSGISIALCEQLKSFLLAIDLNRLTTLQTVLSALHPNTTAHYLQWPRWRGRAGSPRTWLSSVSPAAFQAAPATKQSYGSFSRSANVSTS